MHERMKFKAPPLFSCSSHEFRWREFQLWYNILSLSVLYSLFIKSTEITFSSATNKIKFLSGIFWYFPPYLIDVFIYNNFIGSQQAVTSEIYSFILPYQFLLRSQSKIWETFMMRLKFLLMIKKKFHELEIIGIKL